jgi:chromosome segregation ATPase
LASVVRRSRTRYAELAETERRLQQVRDAQGASQAELANAHSEQERLTQEREHLEQAIASLAANRDRLAAEQASFGQRRSELQAQTDQQRSELQAQLAR